MDVEAARTELETLLDGIGYDLTSARSSGLSNPDATRAALKQARDKLADADALVGAITATT